MNFDLIYKVAEADTDSPLWGSAAQDKAQDVVSLIASRSWCDDEFQAECLSDRIAYEYGELVRLLKPRIN